VISKIETGDRPPAEDFPPRLDAVLELDTQGALTRLWRHLKKSMKQQAYGWFGRWADIEAAATSLRFDTLRAEALPRAASRDLIRKVAEQQWT
jgi:hypothetical protein